MNPENEGEEGSEFANWKAPETSEFNQPTLEVSENTTKHLSADQVKRKVNRILREALKEGDKETRSAIRRNDGNPAAAGVIIERSELAGGMQKLIDLGDDSEEVRAGMARIQARMEELDRMDADGPSDARDFMRDMANLDNSLRDQQKEQEK